MTDERAFWFFFWRWMLWNDKKNYRRMQRWIAALLRPIKGERSKRQEEKKGTVKGKYKVLIAKRLRSERSSNKRG